MSEHSVARRPAHDAAQALCQGTAADAQGRSPMTPTTRCRSDRCYELGLGLDPNDSIEEDE